MKVKVYSRFETPMEFKFSHYSSSRKGGVEVIPGTDEERIILNGINEVVNHTRLTLPYAATIFSDENGHDLQKRLYTLDDLERLKKDTTFNQMLANGDVSIDCPDDVSRDVTGVGKLTDTELAERQKNVKDGDSTARLVAARG